jgi:hypothetical protein
LEESITMRTVFEAEDVLESNGKRWDVRTYTGEDCSSEESLGAGSEGDK